MADPEGSRKLEAILAADVAGYSRLMQEDDEATVATLEAYRAVFREKIQAHHGRVVDMAGDSVLAVFEAATEAVRAAFEIQGVLAERNQAIPVQGTVAASSAARLRHNRRQANPLGVGDEVTIEGIHRLSGAAQREVQSIAEIHACLEPTQCP